MSQLRQVRPWMLFKYITISLSDTMDMVSQRRCERNKTCGNRLGFIILIVLMYDYQMNAVHVYMYINAPHFLGVPSEMLTWDHISPQTSGMPKPREDGWKKSAVCQSQSLGKIREDRLHLILSPLTGSIKVSTWNAWGGPFLSLPTMVSCQNMKEKRFPESPERVSARFSLASSTHGQIDSSFFFYCMISQGTMS